jgi:DNA-binding CsgD family transcriptional regulator
MRPQSLDRPLAIGVVAVALFNTLSALSLPVRDRKPAVALVLGWLGLLLAHAGLYWRGAELRDRVGVRWYVVAQASVVFVVGLSGMLFPVGAGLFIALTAQVILLAGPLWGTLPITTGAILLFAAAAALTQDLYRGATVGLLLAITGVVAHALAMLIRRAPGGPATGGPAAPEPRPEEASAALREPPTIRSDGRDLTPRELEVLQAIVSGARSGAIAASLGITERTVKAHLASIYQKLGVDSRAAAVAAALRRGLT